MNEKMLFEDSFGKETVSPKINDEKLIKIILLRQELKKIKAIIKREFNDRKEEIEIIRKYTKLKSELKELKSRKDKSKRRMEMY